ncbi:MAG: dihydroorotate dehydrogenase-like protein [Candidatus Methylumidiphilus sp.]
MNLATTYMGLTLKHPIAASASPLSGGLDSIKSLEDGGAAAIVMPSLFEEKVRCDNELFSDLMELGTHCYAESLHYFGKTDMWQADAENYLDLLRRASAAVDLPVIASLNCVTRTGWAEYARQMQQAGAAGIELNIYAVESDMDIRGAAVEQRYLDIVADVKASVAIPIAVKLSPLFSAMGNMAKRLDQAGADALVLFNRFYQPDIDVQSLRATPFFGLSQGSEIRLPLLWMALLHGKLSASLAATRGVETHEEVVKYLLAGADVVMVASALLRNGPGYTATLLDGLKKWMAARGFASVGQFRGAMSQGKADNPGAFQQANCARVLGESLCGCA